MKKDRTSDGTDKRKMSKLEKENARLKSQNEQLRSDNKQLRSDLGKERKKKDVKVIGLSREQERLLLNLLKGTPSRDS
jgi:cell division protein FtsB